jgi:hypothetical protein
MPGGASSDDGPSGPELDGRLKREGNAKRVGDQAIRSDLGEECPSPFHIRVAVDTDAGLNDEVEQVWSVLALAPASQRRTLIEVEVQPGAL